MKMNFLFQTEYLDTECDIYTSSNHTNATQTRNWDKLLVLVDAFRKVPTKICVLAASFTNPIPKSCSAVQNNT